MEGTSSVTSKGMEPRSGVALSIHNPRYGRHDRIFQRGKETVELLMEGAEERQVREELEQTRQKAES